MKLLSRFSYQKLKQAVILDDQDDYIRRSSSTKNLFCRLKKRKFRIKIAGFRRLFRIRRIKVAKLSWTKVMKRLKESQSHFGDLFAGNYMFMQVTPASYNNKPYLAQHKHNYNSKISGFLPRYNDNYAIEKVV